MSGVSAANTAQQNPNNSRAEKEVKQIAAATLEEDDEFEDFPVESECSTFLSFIEYQKKKIQNSNRMIK